MNRIENNIQMTEFERMPTMEDINLDTYGSSKQSRYQETLLYGQHGQPSLRKFAQGQALEEKNKQEAERRRPDIVPRKSRKSFIRLWCRPLTQRWKVISQTAPGKDIEDFIFLTALGVVVATFSFIIDLAIFRCHAARSALLTLLDFSVAGQFFAWIAFFVIMTCFSVGITHAISPTAIGSGIPEIKTMIRGVAMKEYLTFKTLIAKVIGLTAALGSGLPVGKEGPFVHIAGVSAAVIARQLPSFKSNHEESRLAEMLMPASAVGVSCTFAAPVGGLLYSLESTSSYFAMRNYWRGFYASAIGTLFFRLLAIWFHEERTLTALERTNLPQEVPFDPAELFAFILLGVLCGIFGVGFIVIHKSIVLFFRGHETLKKLLQMNRFIYPTMVAIIVGALQFPPGLGQFTGGELTNPEALKELYSNFTWSLYNPGNIEEQHILHHWLSPVHNVFLTSFLFFVLRLLICALATTCPLPCGMIVPAFTIGAGLGRCFGEGMASIFPDGIYGNLIAPGGYALVGSVAFAGAVTHTFSPVVIAFELTGQIGHVMPSLLAVMIANVVSRALSPSVYECIIQIKKLPYLPSHIDPKIESEAALAEHIMVKDVQFLTLTSTYHEALRLLKEFPFKLFPIVESSSNMYLIGSISRRQLKEAVVGRLSIERKVQYFSEKLYRMQCHNANFDVGKPEIEGRSETTQPRKISTGSSRFFSVTHLPEGDQRRLSTMSACSQTARKMSSVYSTNAINECDTQAKPQEDHERTTGCRMSDSGRVQFRPTTSLDLHDPEQEEEWLRFELNQRMVFESIPYDTAPYQVVKKTSLYKVHHYFSLLSLHHALVTETGRLVGIVSLSEVRKAVQVEVNCVVGKTPPAHEAQTCCFKRKNNNKSKSLLNNNVKEDKLGLKCS